MGQKVFFPAVETEESEQKQWRATTGITMESVLSPLLRMNPETDDPQEKKEGPRNHRLFLESVAGWPGDVELFLNIYCLPETEYAMTGKVATRILLSATAGNRQSAVARVIGHHHILMGLLYNFFPAMEFVPILDLAELRGAIAPFTPTHVIGIGRRREKFIISSEEKSGLTSSGKNFAIGFLPGERSGNSECSGKEATLDYCFPWKVKERRDLSDLSEAILLHPAPLLLQIRVSPAKPSHTCMHNLRMALHQCEDLLMNPQHHDSSLLTVQLRALRNAMSERIQEYGAGVVSAAAYLCSTAPIDEAMAMAVAAVISPRPFAAQDEHISLYGGCSVKKIDCGKFNNHSFFFDHDPYTPEEVSSMFRFPVPKKTGIAGLPIREFRTVPVPPVLLKSGNGDRLILGDNYHRGYVHEIGVDVETLMRHTFLLGMTGTGKSNMLLGMVMDAIESGHGLCLIDPHGDLVNDILQIYPEKRRDDLVLVDFHDPSHLVPMNFLYWRHEEERDLIIDDLYSWLDQTYNMTTTGGPMFEYYFRSFLRVLMGDRPRSEFVPTIGDFIRMFRDKSFRELCLRSVTDPQVKLSLEQAERTHGDVSIDNIAPYITSKLNRFNLDKNLQRMTGQERMAIDFSEVMNKGKIMLVNLGRGRYGEVVTGLLASQIVSRFRAAAMQRISMPKNKRRDFFLFVDEFQNIASENFISLLSEARKFRLGLILANQYADQLDTSRLSGEKSVLQAILGNVGVVVNFRVGIKDSELMEPIFVPDISRYDLINLPTGHCYVNIKTGIHKPVSVSMKTRLHNITARKNHAERLRAISQKKYAIPVKEADSSILAHNQRIEEALKALEQEHDNDLDCFSTVFEE